MTSLEPIPDSALKRLGGELAQLLDDDQWNNTEKRYLLPALKEQDALRAEVEALTKKLNTANANHERFEREWYLRGDEIEALQARIAELEAALTEIANYAQERSQGPTVFDALWDVRSKALMALRGEWT